jgi:hypothetical protein
MNQCYLDTLPLQSIGTSSQPSTLGIEIINKFKILLRFDRNHELKLFQIEHGICLCDQILILTAMKLTITEHVQPLCTRKPVYYIHGTWAGYAANLKMPTKS